MAFRKNAVWVRKGVKLSRTHVPAEPTGQTVAMLSATTGYVPRSEGGSWSWASIHAAAPCCSMSRTTAMVGPKVACAARRTASGESASGFAGAEGWFEQPARIIVAAAMRRTGDVTAFPPSGGRPVERRPGVHTDRPGEHSLRPRGAPALQWREPPRRG